MFSSVCQFFWHLVFFSFVHHLSSINTLWFPPNLLGISYCHLDSHVACHTYFWVFVFFLCFRWKAHWWLYRYLCVCSVLNTNQPLLSYCNCQWYMCDYVNSSEYIVHANFIISSWAPKLLMCHVKQEMASFLHCCCKLAIDSGAVEYPVKVLTLWVY
jgi:hypothetical protein